jgi:cytochrome c-type biogenesis protein CcmH
MNADQFKRIFRGFLKSSKPVRGELVEPHLHIQNQPLRKQPFDKLRANGGLLEASFLSTPVLARTFKHFCLKVPVLTGVFSKNNVANVKSCLPGEGRGPSSCDACVTKLDPGLRRDDNGFRHCLPRRPSAFIGGSPTKHLRSSAFICGLILSLSLSAVAQLPTPAQPLPSPELALRLKKLESELRCLVCQNQTLAESPAGLAGDLRREVRLLIDDGKSDDEIKKYLQARYGDFVLYKPPVDPKTYVLWFGPFVLLGGGAMLVWWIARRRRLIVNTPVKRDEAAIKKARRLLDDDEADKK